MKFIAQIITLTGIILTAIYGYLRGFSFHVMVAFLSFVAGFASTFFLSRDKSMVQSVGDNSKTYQAGRDINIKD